MTPWDKLKEECGIFAIVSHPEAARLSTSTILRPYVRAAPLARLNRLKPLPFMPHLLGNLRKTLLIGHAAFLQLRVTFLRPRPAQPVRPLNSEG